MYFYRQMYCDDAIKAKKNKILRRLRMNAGQLSVYTVSLASGADLFDIMHCANIKQKYFDRKHLYVIGIASSYEEATGLAGKMVMDFHQKYGTYQFKKFLLENNKDWY